VPLTDATPVPAPEKPSEEEAWTPLVCLKLADYYRGETSPESMWKDSPYQKAVQAAIRLVKGQGMSYQQVDAVFRYMKGSDEALKDDWWGDKKVDLWHVADHCTVKLREIERKSRKLQLASLPASSPEQPSLLLSEDKQQRNLNRLRALAATRAQQQEQIERMAACG
jgi:hypothetical protein